MGYSDEQIGKIINMIIAKAKRELLIAQENNTVEAVMAKYGVTFEEKATPVNVRSKIMVFGALAGKKKVFQQVVREMHIPEECVVFENDYERLTNFDTSILKDSMVYSDLILGPTPHKEAGIGEASSLAAAIEKEPNRYPRLFNLRNGSEPKLTVTKFKEALHKTKYFDSIFRGID